MPPNAFWKRDTCFVSNGFGGLCKKMADQPDLVEQFSADTSQI